MKYAILRTQKLKATGAVWRSLKHAFREQPTPNADPDKAAKNEHVGATSAAEAMEKVRARLPEKRRKDAVLAIEYLITASPEAMQGMGARGRPTSTTRSSGCVSATAGPMWSTPVCTGTRERRTCTPTWCPWTSPPGG